MVQICARCILDSSIPGIRFDDERVCNYCKIHDEMEKKYPLNEMGRQKFNQLLAKIKAEGKGKRYDCIAGVSGGTDSTYCLYMAKKLGLRPLAVHLDNGWNSGIAADNIKNVVTKLDVNLRTITCDWEEFKDIQISFLKASVPDVEMPTDLAILSVLYRVAADESVRYVINGTTFRTEGRIPIGWTYMDGKYIKSVHKMFGKNKLRSFSNLTISDAFYYIFIKRITQVFLLNYIDYRKEEAKKILEKEVGWKDYGGKHYESVYTRFVSSYLLPEKFHIDKRIVEYSALVRSNQMTKDEALRKMKEDPYPKDKVGEDIDYVIKKFGFAKDEFEEIFARKPKTFLDYPTYYPVIKKLKVLINLAHRLNLSPKKFYDVDFIGR